MILFTKKFSTKPSQPRILRSNVRLPAIKEDTGDFKSITLSLGNNQYSFTSQGWVQMSKNSYNHSKLAKSLKILKEKDKLNGVKIEILLDMLAENIRG